MQRYLLKISYDGTSFHGWQVQPNGITVQQTLCEASGKMLGTQISVTGCSRTDAGVHAKEFFCHFDFEKCLPPSAFIDGLNSLLPLSVRVIDAKTVSGDFHARYSAKGKTYSYYIDTSAVQSPFSSRYSLHYPYELDVDKMNEFCNTLVGKHDFAGFSSSKRTVEDTVRTVSECFVKREDNFIVLTVTADGFLYNMVRIIVGTAIEAGRGKLDEKITEIINSLDRADAGDTVPAKGLFLEKVYY